MIALAARLHAPDTGIVNALRNNVRTTDDRRSWTRVPILKTSASHTVQTARAQRRPSYLSALQLAPSSPGTVRLAILTHKYVRNCHLLLNGTMLHVSVRAGPGFATHAARPSLTWRSLRLAAGFWLQLKYTLVLLMARRQIVDPDADEVVVSLTSYGDRLKTVGLTIESIAGGSIRPKRLMLWISVAEAQHLSWSLRRLRRRGLEIRSCEDWGPHKKYYPYVSGELLTGPLVTADDDVFYPRTWLSDLLSGHAMSPDAVVCHRSRLIATTGLSLAPYSAWPLNDSATAHPRVLPTGVGGVLYPIRVQERLKALGTGFTARVPWADDLWLHKATLDIGATAQQISDIALEPIPIWASRGVGLWTINVTSEANDESASLLYDEENMSAIIGP